jgi:hypothetical protein
VRVTDETLLALLRARVGTRLLDDAALMQRLVAAGPDRVFESRFARIDVCQPIAQPGGHSPEGPHTHLLPHLLAVEAPADLSAPAGWVAQCCAYPPNPLQDESGRPKAFDRAQYDAFQRLLQQYGDPHHLALKRRVTDAIAAGADPDSIGEVDDEGKRTSVRIAVRQARCLQADAPVLRRWHDRFDARSDLSASGT